MSDKMRRLLERGGIFMKDPELEGGSGGGGDNGTTDDSADTDSQDSGSIDTNDGGDTDEGGEDDGSDDGDGDDDGEDDGDGSDSDDDDKPSAREAKLLKESMQRKKRIREQDSTIAELKDQLKQVTDVLGDVDLGSVGDLIKSHKDKETQELEKKGEYDKVVERMKRENADALKERDDTIAEQKGTIGSLMAKIEDMTVGRAFGDSSYVQDGITLTPRIARREFGEYFDFVDGEVVGFDKPRGAEGRQALIDAAGDNKPFDKALEELVDAHPDAKSIRKAKLKKGSGSKTVTTDGDDGSTEDKKVRGASRIQAALNKQ